ncbi:hemolysin family protein [Aerococcus sp. UMB7834]|uniref:hemolysin family protein n=1 Tax=Aerococcus sp. UMB7834 TaxID=3046342 RepID=UPI00254BCC06|nr:hemolysin family protein [Aerococcus sp. UMB7834]MDK6805868.1 hemolysin family protein [Aerococcus sp. UMB7834]
MEGPGAETAIVSQLLIILVLTLINAFLAGAEMAFVSVNHQKIGRLADQGNKAAKRVQALLDDSDAFLSTIQVGITFAGFFSSAQAATTFVGYIRPYLGQLPGADILASALVTLVLSYISLVFGELFPKQVAIQFPEKYSMMASGAIVFLKRLFTPFVWLLTASTNLLKRLVPIDFTKKDEHLTREEMRALIENSQTDGAIDMTEFRMMQGVLSLDSKLAREVMVPRTDTFMLDIDDPDSFNVQETLSSQYSRVPVFADDKDDILGVVHVKDILRQAHKKGFDQVRIKDVIKPAYFAPETIFIDDLMLQFKKDHQHMAILKDEYGGVVGIVTLEDLLEEIVGEIEDEYDEANSEYRQLDESNYAIDGMLPIYKFNQIFQTDIQSDESDTIAGYMIEQLGHFPEDGAAEHLQIENYELLTTLVEEGRIRGIRVTRLAEDASQDDENKEDD